MQLLKHPNIVRLIGYSCSPYSIVMELMQAGNLYDFVNSPDSLRDWGIGVKIAIDVGCGLHYMHTSSPPFVHRDLKSPNILVCSGQMNLVLLMLFVAYCSQSKCTSSCEDRRFWYCVSTLRSIFTGKFTPRRGEPHVVSPGNNERATF